MKKLFLLAFLMFGLISVKSYAQEEAEEVTEEEMMKFAVMEDNVAAFVAEKQATMEDMIKKNETLGGGGRYNEIKKAWGDDAKLTELEVSEEEKEAYEEIQEYIDGIGKEVVKYKTELIMDAEVLGAATYNKVKKAMDSDPTVKAEVDAMIAQLKEQRANADGEVTQ